MRIDPDENLHTVVVIPIPARRTEFGQLFVTLTIAGRNLATPTSDKTEIQRLVDLLAYMKANLRTYTGVTDQLIARNLPSLRPTTQKIDEEGRCVI